MSKDKKSSATTTRRLLDEASPLLLHHQLTNGATASAACPSTTNNNNVVATTAKKSSSSSSSKSSARDDDGKSSSSSALVMLVSASSNPASLKEPNASSDDDAMQEDDDAKQQQATNLWERYNRALEKDPFVVKSITAFFILSLGDLCGQGVEHWIATNSTNITAAAEALDWQRTLRFGLLGLVGAPWTHLYFHYLDTFLPPTPSQPCSWITILKLVIDQGVQAPAILALMISVLAVLKGTGWTGVQTDMQANYWDALVANWKLWIPASLVNLAFVKPTLRVLYVNLVFFLWTIVLSILLN